MAVLASVSDIRKYILSFWA